MHQSIVALAAVSANAGVEEPRFDRGYEITRNVQRREFLQNLAGRPATEGRRIRFIDPGVTRQLIQGCVGSPDYERVQRAARQYRAAIGYLRPGGETLVLAHLFMGVEAITNVVLTWALHEKACDEEMLARDWGVPWDEHGRRNLLAVARRRLVFQGDDDTHRNAKLASDGFEHGFKDLQKVQRLAERVHLKTALYLREAILRSCSLKPATLERLVGFPFGHPVHSHGGSLMIGGMLCGKGNELAPSGQTHPGVTVMSLHGRAWHERGALNVEQQGLFRVHLARGIALEEKNLIAESPEYDAERSDVRPVSIETLPLGNDDD